MIITEFKVWSIYQTQFEMKNHFNANLISEFHRVDQCQCQLILWWSWLGYRLCGYFAGSPKTIKKWTNEIRFSQRRRRHFFGKEQRFEVTGLKALIYHNVNPIPLHIRGQVTYSRSSCATRAELTLTQTPDWSTEPVCSGRKIMIYNCRSWSFAVVYMYTT